MMNTWRSAKRLPPRLGKPVLVKLRAGGVTSARKMPGGRWVTDRGKVVLVLSWRDPEQPQAVAKSEPVKDKTRWLGPMNPPRCGKMVKVQLRHGELAMASYELGTGWINEAGRKTNIKRWAEA